jgi:hypothetical protein
MQLWKGWKCSKHIWIYQCDHMAIIIIFKCFEIMALGSCLHLKTLQLDFWKKKETQNWRNFEKKTKMLQTHWNMPIWSHGHIFLIFKNVLKF